MLADGSHPRSAPPTSRRLQSPGTGQRRGAARSGAPAKATQGSGGGRSPGAGRAGASHPVPGARAAPRILFSTWLGKWKQQLQPPPTRCAPEWGHPLGGHENSPRARSQPVGGQVRAQQRRPAKWQSWVSETAPQGSRGWESGAPRDKSHWPGLPCKGKVEGRGCSGPGAAKPTRGGKAALGSGRSESSRHRRRLPGE